MPGTSQEAQILQRLKDKLTTLTWVKKVETEMIRNLFTDFNEAELPAIQIFDAAPATIAGAKSLVNVRWPLQIECVLKSTKAHTFDQGEMLDKKKAIEDVISADLSLLLPAKIPGFINLQYVSFETDLHTTPGFYAIILRFDALYSKEFPGCG